MRFLIDENMPRSLKQLVTDAGFDAEDVRDIGLHGRPDTQVLAVATAGDAIVITRDRGYIHEREWPEEFTAGVILVSLPANAGARDINARVMALLLRRLPESLLGAVTILEPHRALSRILRRRP